MSFRDNEGRRYGHVPPVQYPVSNQQPQQAQQPAQDPSSYLPRRPSFNSGDDGAAAHADVNRMSYQPTINTGGLRGMSGEDELFIASPGGQARPQYGAPNSALSGYQHQYAAGANNTTPTSTYNPQDFAPQNPQSLPYHPHPSNSVRYGSTGAASPTYATPAAATSYTPAPYNPAAYSNTSPAVPQRQPTYAGYSNYTTQGYASPPMNSSGYWTGQQSYTTATPAQPQVAANPPAAYTGYEQVAPNQQMYAGQTSAATTPQAGGYDPSYGQYSSYPTSTTSRPTSSYSTATAQAPYPTQSHIPVGPNYAGAENLAATTLASRPSLSGAHATPSPPVHPQSASPGLQRHPTNAPLPSRPMEDSHEQRYGSNGMYENDLGLDQRTNDNMMQDIEAELGRATSHRNRPSGVDQRNGSVGHDDLQNLRRLTSSASYNSQATTLASHDDPNGVNRYSSNASTLNRNHSHNPYAHPEEEGGDESDPEGAAGLLAMQQADADERRLSGGGSFGYFTQPEVTVQPALPTHAEEPGASSDSDYAGAMDLGSFGGDFTAAISYDNNLGPSEHMPAMPPDPQQSMSMRAQHSSQRSHESNRYPAFEQADVDYGGTGGLQAPRAHRLSFDEGDEEDVTLHSTQSGSESPYKEDMPDLFWHPGISNRPLPAIPANSDSSSLLSVQSPNRPPFQHTHSGSTDRRGYPAQDVYSGPDADYGQNAQQLQVERSISLSSHSTSPHVQPPVRSHTDAAKGLNAQYRQSQQQQQLAQQGLPYDVYEQPGTPSSMNYDMITLPQGKRTRFIPEKLKSIDVQSCYEPWALSGIAQWIREMAGGEPDLRRSSVEAGIIRLFCLKVPTMNVADAESLSEMVVNSFLEAGILVPEEEWLKFGQGTISGVLWQLTGAGCYSPRSHLNDDDQSRHELATRCYSKHCTRTLKKADLSEILKEGEESKDWARFYNLTKELVDASGKSSKEVNRQNVLHELVTTEEAYLSHLEILRVLYRDQIVHSSPAVITPARMEKWVTSVFGKADSVEQVNKNFLLAQLKYRQKEQGPWIVGFSDIFREWIRKAKVPYLEYSGAYPYAEFLVRRESQRNALFARLLDSNRKNAKAQKLDWTTFLKAPITHLQRIILLLETIHKRSEQESEEKTTLQKAIDEIKSVAVECDARVGEMDRKVQMIELDQMLVLRPGFHADLNLDHLGRELILQGDLQRVSAKGMKWVDTHALLFDHYFILAKLVQPKDGRHDRKYDVSKEPIPMPLMFLESSQEEPWTKTKGIAASLPRAANSASDVKLNKVTSNSTDRPSLEHSVTSSSLGAPTITRLTSNDDKTQIFPFKIKHLGHEDYTLFAQSAGERANWCRKIIEAKTRHAKALHAQNAEPFRLRVIADSAFAYDAASQQGKFQMGVHIHGTPLDRALRELEKVYGPGRGPPPVCRAAVNCATGFTAFGKSMVAVGTDVGVYVAEASDPRSWTKTAAITKATQIAVLEEFSVVLVLAERQLISYPLDVIAPPSSFPAPSNDNPRRSPQRLGKDVTFFATARMKDRMLVFYKRKESMHTTFKVIEPVFNKATEKKSRLFSGSKKAGAGTTESFRDYDDFYLPTECYSLNIFQTYIAVSTARGFELLTLDKKVPMSIPDLKQPAIANIANRIKDQRPLGMFRLNDQEFLLAYEDCAVYVDTHGDISRSVIMEYSGRVKARGATMYGQYLLLFNVDYVEVRNAENGRLRQIIAGRDVKVLDYGVRGPTGGFQGPANANGAPAAGDGSSQGTVKLCMAHPELTGQQIVLEMLLNDGHTEK